MNNSIWVNVFIEKEWVGHTEFEICPIPGDKIEVWTRENKLITLLVSQRVIKDKALNNPIILICSKI